jgi:hypothetical protein
LGGRGLEILIRFALGAAIFSLLFTLLALSRLAYSPVVIALALIPLALLPRYLRAFRCPHFAVGSVRSLGGRDNLLRLVLIACILQLALFAFAQCIALARGGDLNIYHLVIPRTVVWTHGLDFNRFSHDAGLYYGWQLYALPAYLMGHERAFQLCSFAALTLFVLSTYRFISARYGSVTGLVGALVASAMICGMSRESIVNNDVPLVLVETALLTLACFAVPGRLAALSIGLVGGFAVAIKLTAIATIPVSYAIFVWRARTAWSSAVLLAGLGTVVSLTVWPAFDYFSSGSPLPHFLLAWPPDTGYLPQFRESISYLMEYFGIWYQKNVSRLFSQGLEFVPVLLAGLLALPFVRSGRTDRLCLALAGLAIARTVTLLAANHFDTAVLYHDRYHLISYLLLGLAGMLCLVHVARLTFRSTWIQSVLLGTSAIVLTLHLYQTRVVTVDVIGNAQPDGKVTLSSLRDVKRAAFKSFRELPGGGPGGIGFDVAARLLPPDAVLATTAIDPYLLQRPFLQMLPVSENVIDLSSSPARLRADMVLHGATHLHLTEYSGLNIWMKPMVDKWLNALREIPKLTDVRRLIWLNYPSAKGTQAFYELTPNPRLQTEPAPDFLRELSAARDADGTWWLQWTPNAGGDVEVDWRRTPSEKVLLGEAASDVGWFPIGIGMPADFSVEVVYRVLGRAPQATTLTLHAPGS